MKKRKRAPGNPAEWIPWSKSSLALATATNPGVLYEDLCFRAQQAAEKALRAVFVFQKIPNQYTMLSMPPCPVLNRKALKFPSHYGMQSRSRLLLPTPGIRGLQHQEQRKSTMGQSGLHGKSCNGPKNRLAENHIQPPSIPRTTLPGPGSVLAYGNPCPVARTIGRLQAGIQDLPFLVLPIPSSMPMNFFFLACSFRRLRMYSSHSPARSSLSSRVRIFFRFPRASSYPFGDADCT